MTKLERRWIKNLKPPKRYKYGFFGKCQKKWRQNKWRWLRNMKNWKNPACYDMEVELNCCWCYAGGFEGPYKVQVRNRKVVSAELLELLSEGASLPDDILSEIPTMKELLRQINVQCIVGCSLNKQNGAALAPKDSLSSTANRVTFN